MSEKDIDEVVRVIKKHRLEEHAFNGSPEHETWKEVEADKVSEEMAEYLWHDLGIDVKKDRYDVEVVEKGDSE